MYTKSLCDPPASFKMADLNVDEQKEAIIYYFFRNYKYGTILGFLERFHDIRISRRTLLNLLTDTSAGALRPIYTRRKKWNGSDKKWNGSAKFSSVNRILSVPFVPDPFLKRTATGCGPFQERIG